MNKTCIFIIENYFSNSNCDEVVGLLKDNNFNNDIFIIGEKENLNKNAIFIKAELKSNSPKENLNLIFSRINDIAIDKNYDYFFIIDSSYNGIIYQNDKILENNGYYNIVNYDLFFDLLSDFISKTNLDYISFNKNSHYNNKTKLLSNYLAIFVKVDKNKRNQIYGFFENYHNMNMFDSIIFTNELSFLNNNAENIEYENNFKNIIFRPTNCNLKFFSDKDNKIYNKMMYRLNFSMPKIILENNDIIKEDNDNSFVSLLNKSYIKKEKDYNEQPIIEKENNLQLKNNNFFSINKKSG